MSLLRSPKKQATPLSLPDPSTSLLIPANPALVNPGSSPTSRGGILLNPLGADKDSGNHLRARSPGGGGGGSRPGAGERKASWLSRSTSSFSSRTATTTTTTAESSSSVRSSSVGSSSSSSDRNAGTESTAGTSIAPAATPSPSLKFAPLPESGRKRSSSIACMLGAAPLGYSIYRLRSPWLIGSVYAQWESHRELLCCKASIRSTPRRATHLQLRIGSRVVRPSSLLGIMADRCQTSQSASNDFSDDADVHILLYSVKTVKDIKPGLKKAWGKIRRGSSASRDRSDDASVSSSGKERADSFDSSAASVTTDTTSDMSAADERASGVSDSSSVISDTSIEEVDEEAIATDEAEQDIARGRPAGRMSPVHLHGGNRSYSHAHSNPAYGGSALASSPEQLAHFLGETASGEATPRRRLSPPGHPYGRVGRSQPASGENTPRRRLSLSDVPAGEGEQARADRHHQAVFGFDEHILNSRFDKLGLQRMSSQEASPAAAEAAGVELDSSISRESENSLDESESDVPIPDSRQVAGAAKEMAV